MWKTGSVMREFTKKRKGQVETTARFNPYPMKTDSRYIRIESKQAIFLKKLSGIVIMAHPPHHIFQFMIMPKWVDLQNSYHAGSILFWKDGYSISPFWVTI